jgi:aspartate-semialdehyde dehydrogenase
VTDWPVVGVAGARGVVGGVFLSILADAGLPAGWLRTFGSEAGTVAFGDGVVPVRHLDEAAAHELDVLFLATDAATSRAIVEGPGREVPLIVDNSSAFRLDPDVEAATWSPIPTAPRPPRQWPSRPSVTWPGWNPLTLPRTRR